MHHLTKLLFSVALFIFSFAGYSFAQTDAELTEAATKVAFLLDQKRFKEAVPYLEKLAKASPNDADLHMTYGVALLFGSKQVDDAAEAKKMSDAALVELQAAKKLGSTNPDLDVAINLLTGKESGNSSATSPGDKYFQQAEVFFAQSKYDEALKMYQKALDADPKRYESALYMGDCYVAKQDWDNAEKSYQKAIEIDPNRETAYRYSATPFMKQKKYDTARDLYIEAFIIEPYSKMSSDAMSAWALVTGAKLGHPKVDIPKEADTKKDGPWAAYFAARSAAEKGNAPAPKPGEMRLYRHNLKDEAAAIRSLLAAVKGTEGIDPQIVTLQELEKEGLLESFILLALADQGIAQDHPAYLKDNRAKLRQYVLNYAIHK